MSQLTHVGFGFSSQSNQTLNVTADRGCNGHPPDNSLSKYLTLCCWKLTRFHTFEKPKTLLILYCGQIWRLNTVHGGYVHKRCWWRGKPVLHNKIFQASAEFISCIQNGEENMGIKIYTARMRDNGLHHLPKESYFNINTGCRLFKVSPQPS